MDSVSPQWCKFSTPLHQVAELRMCALSNCIREKPSWWEEVNDEATVRKWREEAMQQVAMEEATPWGDETSLRVAPTMVKDSYLPATATHPYLYI